MSILNMPIPNKQTAHWLNAICEFILCNLLTALKKGREAKVLCNCYFLLSFSQRNYVVPISCVMSHQFECGGKLFSRKI